MRERVGHEERLSEAFASARPLKSERVLRRRCPQRPGRRLGRSAPALAALAVAWPVNAGYLFAINATTGNLRWRRRVDSHPYAILTAGPLAYNGVIYQGVASSEEHAAANSAYACCTFRGSIVALDAGTGGILWKTYMVPNNFGVACQSQSPASGCGYSGGAIWSTTPAIDPATNTLFVTTGNNY